MFIIYIFIIIWISKIILRLENKYWEEAGLYERLMDGLDAIPDDQRITVQTNF